MIEPEIQLLIDELEEKDNDAGVKAVLKTALFYTNKMLGVSGRSSSGEPSGFPDEPVFEDVLPVLGPDRTEDEFYGGKKGEEGG